MFNLEINSAPSTETVSGFPFIFTDESGVVTTSKTQPFYGIGMIKISDAGRWSDGLNALLDRYISSVAKPGVPRPRSRYEFHFSKLTAGTRKFYEDLIDFYVAQPDGYFCGLIVDKNAPGIDPIAACGTTWNALIKYSITLLKENISNAERATVISDNYQKPRKSPFYYERALTAGLRPKVTNVLMIESAASIMLQLVDVLLGCVMYDFKAPSLSVIDADKKALADKLSAAYKVRTLAMNITCDKPNYFSVWKLRPTSP